MITRILALFCLLVAPVNLPATGTYQEPEAFLAEVFAGNPPPPKVLWIKKTLREPIKEIMGRGFGSLRVRYWAQDGRVAWILEEIGKDLPITTGLVVNNGKLERIKVLVFRESRGWEVRHAFFTDQFNDATLSSNYELDRHIDGISGATLSVRALTKLARLALFLSQQVKTDAAT
jgi:hypothetical protein